MLGFIGAGKMAQAMCKGVVSSGLIKPSQIMASDPDGRMLSVLEHLGTRTTHCNRTVVEKNKVVVLAVKPNMVRKILRDVYGLIDKEKQLIISMAAGISLNTLQQELPDHTRVVRAMPNTPALVQHGCTAFARGRYTRPDDGELVETLFSTFGICEEMPEKHLDAVTGLSGSGPGYVAMALEAMADGGVKMGLPRDIAMKFAANTMIGSAKMILETGQHPGILKDSVCSPSGTTINGIYELEKSGFRFALISAVEAASKRSYELGLGENYDTASEASGVTQNQLINPTFQTVETPETLSQTNILEQFKKQDRSGI